MSKQLKSKEIAQLIEVLKKQDLKANHLQQIFEIFTIFHVPTKILAKILGITERRVRQLVDEGVLERAGRGAYSFFDSLTKYLDYKEQLLDQKAEQIGGDDRKRAERYKADLLELRIKEETGELVRKAEVKQEAFTTARKVREALLNIPSRVSTLFAAEKDHVKIHDSLENEIEVALRDLSKHGNIRRNISKRHKARSKPNRK